MFPAAHNTNTQGQGEGGRRLPTAAEERCCGESVQIINDSSDVKRSTCPRTCPHPMQHLAEAPPPCTSTHAIPPPFPARPQHSPFPWLLPPPHLGGVSEPLICHHICW